MRLHEWLKINGYSLAQGAEKLGITRPTLHSLITRGSHAAELGCRIIDAVGGYVTEEDILQAMRDARAVHRVHDKLDAYRIKHGLSKQDMCSLIGYTGSGAKLDMKFKRDQTVRILARCEGLVTMWDLAETHRDWHAAHRKGGKR